MWYENWFGSPYYKILYQNRDDNEAQAFIENLLAHLKPQGNCTMLDIACGEGRHARQLADHGFDVTGIDISLASIETAQAFEQDNLHFYVQDMRIPFYINYFDYAFNFFTSFGYFKYDRDHRLAARSFAAGLKPGGTLVVDYLNYEHVKANLVPDETIIRGSYSFKIHRRVERNHIVKDISFIDVNHKPKHYTESVAIFSVQQFVDMFTAAGMELMTTFGDYKLAPYNEFTSERMIMIFKKVTGS